MLIMLGPTYPWCTMELIPCALAYFGKVLCNDFPKTIFADYVVQP